MEKSDFWNNKEEADIVIKEISFLKDKIDPVIDIKNKVIENLELLKQIQDNDIELLSLIEEELPEIIKKTDIIELQTYLSGDYDSNNCILEIHPGAGGTESCDWASMLYRMYLRYAKDKGYEVIELDKQDEEVGIKSVMLLIKGENAYGYLKGEKGVHRLVRISPFDAGARRHTSFASVEVTPEIDNTIKLELNESDLKIDIYRSSGPGGQGVNTTDSAVRITHLPTGIVVTCQNERSQLRNKQMALEILKSKLYTLELEKQQQEVNDMKKGQMTIGFGSGKRSYIMCPYTLVKDNETGYSTSDVDSVLDGKIEDFIIASLRRIK